MAIGLVRQEIAEFLGLTVAGAPVHFVVHGEEVEAGYRQCRIPYPSVDGESNPPYLLIQFACSSGAAASYRCLMDHQEGIEMSKVIPGFTQRFDIADLVACFSPRPLLVASATENWASLDAPAVVARAQARSEELGSTACVDHLRFGGEHGLTQERFDAVVGWLVQHTVTVK